ncbi:MAG: N-acetylmuramoyl-L-alanine amidase [Planctomycetota bacterium]
MPQPIVVLDPGHGGQAHNYGSSPYGVQGPGGVLEKDVTLALAKRVAHRLGGRANALLTRIDDSNPSLAQRARAAAERSADVFVSLHANGGSRSARGAEVFVHEHAGLPSRTLASSLVGSLATYGRPSRRLMRAPLGVLHPQVLGDRSAGCLVEVDYLSNATAERDLGNAARLDALAGRVAAGIESYLGRATQAPANAYAPQPAYGDGGYFTDTEELNAYMRDQRAADDRRLSTVADARALVDGYVARGAPSVWPHINAARAADEIRDRCADHRLFQQGNLNLCGPAAFLLIWAGRDPVAYANYALGMLEHGRARIGSRNIQASAAHKALRYPRLGRPSTMTTPAADFVAMAPLRQNANDILPYDPSSSTESLEGATTPGELAEWLQLTGAFSTVRDGGNWMRSAGIDHALRLLPGTGMDIAMLINVNALAQAARVETISGSQTSNPVAPDESFILSMFPNHFVVLVGEVVPDTSARTVSLSAWTWGGTYVFEGIPVRAFSSNYYGAVEAHLRS